MIVYLASPYSHADPSVREQRYRAACQKAAQLILEDPAVSIFAPISHSHPISLEMPTGKATDHDLWMAQDLGILRRCDKLIVLMLDGWDHSRGVTEEIAVARACHIPVEFEKP